MKRDYYEILGINKTANQAEIKKAYRELSKKYHPDKNPDGEEMFKEINEAYSVLSDSEKKNHYDRFGHNEPKNSGFNSAYDFFRHHYASPQTYTPKGQSIRITLQLTLEEVFSGITKKIKINHDVKCDSCNGVGGDDAIICPVCKGSGQILSSSTNGFMIIQEVTTCRNCEGTGKVIKNKCNKCHGNGVNRTEEVIEITIPMGIPNGAAIIVAEKGHAVRGGVNGDLIVVIQVKKHDLYIRENMDLIFPLELKYFELILGAEKEIPLIEGGKVKITIKELIKLDTLLRVKGKGMQEYGSRGDLYVQIKISLPEEITEKEKELLNEIKKINESLDNETKI